MRRHFPARGRRALAWSAVLALLLLPLPLREREPPAPTFGLRLLGPIASVAASIEWVRFDSALDAGRPGLAYSRARRALELDPGSTEAWAYLAAHFVYGRGAAEVEPDPGRRAEWIRAALALLERGESRARRPAALAQQRGLILAAVGDEGEAVRWPGGAQAAYRAAAAAFERAAQLGDPLGHELAHGALEAARAAGAPGGR